MPMDSLSGAPAAGQPPRGEATGAAKAGGQAALDDQLLVVEFDTHQPPSGQLQPPARAHSISLYRSGIVELDYAGRPYLIDRPALLLCHQYPSAATRVQQPATGFHCFFTDEFLGGAARLGAVRESPLLQPGANPVFWLSVGELAAASRTFQLLRAETTSDYRHKEEVLRLWLQLLLHQAMRLRPGEPPVGTSATMRLTAEFLHLLEQQFPIGSPGQRLSLHTAQAFAERLGVHVNYLNRVVRATTGRTTSAHLAERIGQEAQALLRGTDWPVAWISASLGFAASSYFNRFFRKQTGHSPNSFRQQADR